MESGIFLLSLSRAHTNTLSIIVQPSLDKDLDDQFIFETDMNSLGHPSNDKASLSRPGKDKAGFDDSLKSNKETCCSSGSGSAED